MSDSTSVPYQTPAHLEHRFTTPDGRTLAVAEWGDPDGLPVISHNGTPGGRISCWSDPTIYARHGVRRITFDRPGYGLSTRKPARIVADVVPDVELIADGLGLDRFAVTGGSGGGPHALACAALLGDRVIRCSAFVSVAPLGEPGLPATTWTAGMTDGNIAEFEGAMAGEDACRAVVEPARTTTLERLAAGRSDFFGDDYELAESDQESLARHLPSIRDDTVHALEVNADGWVDDNLAFVAPWGFDVSTIRVPVYLVYGRADTLVPASHGDWLAANIPGARSAVDDAGHTGNDEDVEYAYAWLAGRADAPVAPRPA